MELKKYPACGWFFLLCVLGCATGWTEDPPSGGGSQKDLSSLSIEQLLKTEVTSVSKSPERSFEAPAAIAVITQEDIRRSGVTSIPEALRLLPGVEVARINANEWSVGIRGFGSRLARSTLVLIDGRSVYSPLFAGTYWEIQDTLLEDIDRIEVIRGPGSALWGANAVNGVINIITKNSKQTQGNLLTAGGGTQEKDFGSFRHGGSVGQNFHYRYYGKYTDRDSSFNRVGDNDDAWKTGQAGFRTDWDPRKKDSLTVQGDAYDGAAGGRITNTTYSFPFSETVEKNVDFSGANLLGRWNHKEATSDSQLQFYYDRTRRADLNFGETRNTFDIDFQHSLSFFRRQQLTYGAGYRMSVDNIDPVIPTVVFDPMDRIDDLASAFVQDQISLLPNRLALTLGSKFEHYNYSGWEIEPNGRLAWTPTAQQTVWGAVSRAVRTPSRVEQDLNLTEILDPATTTFARLEGNKNFNSEKVVAYEMGYRIQPYDSLAVGLAGFYNVYNDLLSVGSGGAPFAESDPPPDKTVVPLVFDNQLKGETYGGELGSAWSLVNWWRLRVAYSFLRMNLHSEAGSIDTTTAPATEGASPRHQLTLRSLMNLPHALEFDPTLRYVSELPSEDVPAYWEMDAHLGWHARNNLEFSLVGQNLLHNHHPEAAGTNEIERGVYGKVTWRWRT